MTQSDNSDGIHTDETVYILKRAITRKNRTIIDVSRTFINGKTNCSTFTKHFVPNLILLTQNK
ncbi:hypothetical protein, partial [Bacteroides thetaiotaomicron]|uniref:hypothetical protein n=1 Tax=Bacteroides thetaiotaomicron TaxID=818 RepID=UPI0034A29993